MLKSNNFLDWRGPSQWASIIIFFLFFVGFAVRIVGVNWGYAHPDENISMAAKVLTGNLIPDSHYYPPLLNYLVAGSFAATYIGGRFGGAWANVEQFRAEYFSNPELFKIAARSVTAALGALLAPLFYMSARWTGLGFKASLFCGLVGLLSPANVLFSHFSKSDIGMTSAVVLVAGLLILKSHEIAARRLDYWLGLALVLAVSFKHSAVFSLIPMLLVWMALRSNQSLEGLGGTVKRVLVVAIIGWPILNIGIILDFQNFLSYQKLQSQFSNRSDGIYIPIETFLNLLVSDVTGVGYLSSLTFVGLSAVAIAGRTSAPVLNWQIWLPSSVLISVCLILYIVGGRQPASLWLPQFTLIQLYAALGLARLFSSVSKFRRFFSILLAGSILIASGAGCLEMMRQAVAPPIKELVRSYMSENIGANTKILSSASWDIPRNQAATDAKIAREQRLAKKYGVTLPSKAPEKLTVDPLKSGFYIIDIPFVIGGLEIYDEKDVKVVKPFAWPIQQEEFHLDYWLDRGFTIFITADIQTYTESKVPAYRRLHGEIQDRCERTKEFLPTKVLFSEPSVQIFDCTRR